MKFPIENDAAVFTTEPIAAGDAFLNALRYDNTGNNLGVRVTTSGGVVVSNGLLFDADGRLVIIDATAGMPANAVASNGLMFSDGALCVGSTVLGLAVLRSFGADAHLYLPGVGYANGIDAGNWLDTSFASTAVDQPVGLAMDAANTSRGPELVVNGDFSSGTTGWVSRYSAAISVAGGRLMVEVTTSTTARAVIASPITTVVNRAYEISATLKGESGTAVCRLKVGNNASTDASYADSPSVGIVASPVTVRYVFTATATATWVGLDVQGVVGSIGSVDDFSVREIPGAIPAINNTTAQKPIVRRDANGRWFWEFSAASAHRLALSAVPFAATDNYCVITSLTQTVAGAADGIAFGQVASASPLLLVGQATNDSARFTIRDNAGGLFAIEDIAGGSIVNQPKVIAGRNVAGVRQLWVDGLLRGASSTSVGAATFDTATLGARSSGGVVSSVMTGSKHGDIFVKGTVSDGQLLTLSRMLAGLQGRTLP